MTRTGPDEESIPQPDAGVPVSVPATGAPLGKAQRTFNRLTGAIAKSRDALALWSDYLPGLQGRLMAELAPIEAAVRAAQRRLVERLDALLAASGKGERLGKRHRAVAVRHLLAVIEELLEQGPDPSLEAIYDRHSAVSLAERRDEAFEEAEAMLGAILGEEALHGHGAASLDELLAHAHAKAEELDAAREAKKAQRRAKRRNGSTKAEQAAARKEQARIEAGRSVRDVFRKLASSLHPDREPDPAERERKTLLMQRANQAYERDDLLALLEIQLEIEQIDAAHLAGLPEERLRHYNAVLGEQLKALEAQLDALLMPVGMEFRLLLRRDSRPAVVDAALAERISDLGDLRDEIESHVLALEDPRRRRTVLDSLVEDEWDEIDFPDAGAMSGFGEGPFAPARGRRQKRKKRG